MMNKLVGSPIEEMPEGFRTVMRVVQSVLMGTIPTDVEKGGSYTEAIESGTIFTVDLRSAADQLEDLPAHDTEVLRGDDSEKMLGAVVFGTYSYSGMLGEIIRATDELVGDRSVPTRLVFKEPGPFGRKRAGYVLTYPRFKLIFLNGSV